MVLGPQGPGRVGRRQANKKEPFSTSEDGFFVFIWKAVRDYVLLTLHT